MGWAGVGLEVGGEANNIIIDITDGGKSLSVNPARIISPRRHSGEIGLYYYTQFQGPTLTLSLLPRALLMERLDNVVDYWS